MRGESGGLTCGVSVSVTKTGVSVSASAMPRRGPGALTRAPCQDGGLTRVRGESGGLTCGVSVSVSAMGGLTRCKAAAGVWLESGLGGCGRFFSKVRALEIEIEIRFLVFRGRISKCAPLEHSVLRRMRLALKSSLEFRKQKRNRYRKRKTCSRKRGV